MDNGITPVMPINDGFGGGNGFMWIFGLLILLGMFNGGYGFGGGNQQYATRDQVQNGFDTQNLQAQTRDILAAVNAGAAQNVAATNQTFHDNLAAMQSLYNETARDIAALQVGQSNLLANQNACSSDTKMMIAGMEQRILQKMDQNEITNLRDQVQQLQLAQATAGMLKFPNNWSYGAGPFPPIYGCCNQGNV